MKRTVLIASFLPSGKQIDHGYIMMGKKCPAKLAWNFLKMIRIAKIHLLLVQQTSAVVDHERSNVHTKSADVINARDQTPSETMNSEAGKALKKLKSSEIHRLTYLFRNAHAVAKQNRPLSDYKWLCDIDRAKGLDLGQTYLTEHAVRSFVQSIAKVERKATEVLIGDSFFFPL